MRLNELFGLSQEAKQKKRIKQIKQQQDELAQQDSHDLDDVVQYFSNLLLIDQHNDKPNIEDRFNMYSGDYLPLATASVIQAPNNVVEKGYRTVAKQHEQLYQRGLEAADNEENKSPIKDHPFKFDKQQLGQYRKEQYGKHAALPT